MPHSAMVLPVVRLGPYDIGRIVTIIEKDEDGSRIETTGILSSIKCKYDSEDALQSMVIRLGGNDADLRNEMAFFLDAEEAQGYQFLFTITTPR